MERYSSAGLRGGISAWRGDQDVWLRGNDIIERHPKGGAARLAKTSRPLANAIISEPSGRQRKLAGAIRGRRRPVDRRFADCRLQTVFFVRSAPSFSPMDSINFSAAWGWKVCSPTKRMFAPDVAEIKRIERQYFRFRFEICQYCRKIFRRCRADVTQILGHDEVGRKPAQSFGVDGINAFAVGAEFAHQSVNLGGRSLFRNAGVDDDGFRTRGPAGNRIHG